MLLMFSTFTQLQGAVMTAIRFALTDFKNADLSNCDLSGLAFVLHAVAILCMALFEETLI
jgi:hypothetical protein